MRPQSYIGVTGVTNREQSDSLMSALPDDSDRLIMRGMLVSGKTLHGESNKWPKRYPEVEKIGGVFSAHPKALNLIHFNTKTPETLLDDMCIAQALAGPHCHGFQLNIAWPDKKTLAHYKMYAPFPAQNKKIVLQCGEAALGQLNREPEQIAARVHEYGDLVDYVLIDPSGGLGRPFSGALAHYCFAELVSRAPDVGIGIAGGLHANNVEDRLSALLSQYNFSIDAEGKLRDENDELNVVEAQRYIATADRVYQRYGTR